MSIIKINYDLGEPIKNSENDIAYNLRKFREGRTYSTNGKFTFEYKGKTFESQYPHFCDASNYYDKKQKDFEFIISIIRNLKNFLDSPMDTDLVKSKIIEFTTGDLKHVGSFKQIDTDKLEFTPYGDDQDQILFNLSDSYDLIFIKTLLFGNKKNNLLHVIDLYEKTVDEIVDFSIKPEFKTLIKNSFPKSTELIDNISVLNTFKIIRQNKKNDTTTFEEINKNTLCYNYFYYKKNIKKIQTEFNTYSYTPSQIYLINLILNYLVFKNESNSYRMQPIISEGMFDISEINEMDIELMKTFINEIINTDNLIEKKDYIDNGMFFVHHEINTYLTPLCYLDFAYDLFNSNDLDKIKVSYLYLIGHECGHLLMMQIFDTINQNKHLSMPERKKIFNEIFTFENIELVPSNVIINNSIYKQYNNLLKNDINARDTGLVDIGGSSESLADTIGFLIIEHFINTHPIFQGKNMKELLKNIFVSICDSYTAQGHADSFVRTNFFIFNENLADKILLGGSNSYKDKYLCYKNKYLKLKAQLNN
jgi:hypothetical protein